MTFPYVLVLVHVCNFDSRVDAPAFPTNAGDHVSTEPVLGSNAAIKKLFTLSHEDSWHSHRLLT